MRPNPGQRLAGAFGLAADSDLNAPAAPMPATGGMSSQPITSLPIRTASDLSRRATAPAPSAGRVAAAGDCIPPGNPRRLIFSNARVVIGQIVARPILRAWGSVPKFVWRAVRAAIHDRMVNAHPTHRVRMPLAMSLRLRPQRRRR
jgi:hypothetical protein